MSAHPHSRYRVPGRPLNLTDRFLLENLRAGRGGKVALIVDHPERGVAHYTYQEVAELAAQYGHELRARGLGLEDRVFIVLEDGVEWVAAFFGAMQIGCTVMFLNPKVSAEELAFYMDDSRCRGMVTTREVAAQLARELRADLAVRAEDGLHVGPLREGACGPEVRAPPSSTQATSASASISTSSRTSLVSAVSMGTSAFRGAGSGGALSEPVLPEPALSEPTGGAAAAAGEPGDCARCAPGVELDD